MSLVGGHARPEDFQAVQPWRCDRHYLWKSRPSAGRFSHLNIATVSLILVLAVRLISAKWGFREAIAASLAGGIVFDYCFLPPYGIGIEDPQHWVVLIAFLAVAIIGSQLSESARKRARQATARPST
ncbi:MAG: DUF4118 domain-containing protein [Acidobacteria bacterium]|nr:DUF4118 domain-containing protein [Acidobacteriota bacterium]